MKNFFFLMLAVIPGLLLSGCGKKAPVRGRIEFTGPKQMVVHFNGREFKGDPISLRTAPGSYNFRFSAPGHYPCFSKVTVKAGQTNKVKVDLAPISSSVLIDSVPQGAKVKFRGEILGATPLVISRLQAGSYSAQLILPGYAEETISWEIRSERPHPRLSTELKMISGKVVIKTIPSSARIFIGGKAVGLSPFTGTLDAGIYKIRAERTGFNPCEDQITVIRGKTVTRVIRMDTRPGALEVTSVPTGAELYLENRKIGSTPRVIDSLMPGNYKIRLVHPGYDTFERIVSVASAATEKVNVKLDPSTGSASFIIQPAGIRCFIDDKFCGTVQPAPGTKVGTQVFTVQNLSPGKHTLTVTHSRAKPIKKEITFSIDKGKHYTERTKIVLWVANCELTYKSGKVETGMIDSEGETDIYYSPAVGIWYRVPKTNIRELRYLPMAENGEN